MRPVARMVVRKGASAVWLSGQGRKDGVLGGERKGGEGRGQMDQGIENRDLTTRNTGIVCMPDEGCERSKGGPDDMLM